MYAVMHHKGVEEHHKITVQMSNVTFQNTDISEKEFTGIHCFTFYMFVLCTFFLVTFCTFV